MQRYSAQEINEPGYALGIGLIAILAALLIGSLVAGVETGPIRPGLGSILLGLYVFAWGLMFLASYYFSHKTFFLRGLMWVCENWSHPSGRGMAFFYFALACGLGLVGILKGLALY